MKLYAFKRFPVRCIIYAKRNRQIVKINDKGRRFSNDVGEFYWRFKRLKKNTLPVSLEFIHTILDDPKKQKNVAYFYSPSPEIYFPTQLSPDMEAALNAGNVEDVERVLPAYFRKLIEDIENPEKVRIPINEKIEQWLDWLGFRIYKNSILTEYKSMWDRYFPQMIFLAAVIFVAISAWIIFRGMEGIMERAASSEARWMQIEQRVLEQDNRLLTLVETGKIPIDIIKPPPTGV